MTGHRRNLTAEIFLASEPQARAGADVPDPVLGWQEEPGDPVVLTGGSKVADDHGPPRPNALRI